MSLLGAIAMLLERCSKELGLEYLRINGAIANAFPIINLEILPHL
jgi:hypothetical protein